MSSPTLSAVNRSRSETAPQRRGGVLDWELVLAPGGRVPSSHAHPRQEESFTVLAGRMRFRVGGAGDRGPRRHGAGPARHGAPFRQRRKPASPGRGADQPGAEHAGTAGNRRGHGQRAARGGPAPAPPARPGPVHARLRAGGAGALPPGRAGRRRHPPARLAGQAARSGRALPPAAAPDARRPLLRGRRAGAPPMPAVEVAHLVKRYRGARRNAVDDISFEVAGRPALLPARAERRG